MKKINPLKLNNLQLKTLTLARLIAQEPGGSLRNEETGEVTLMRLPQAHGDHVHIGAFVVPVRDASGFTNPAVWVALSRKGLSHGSPDGAVTLTQTGLDYVTGMEGHFQTVSDH